MPFLFHFIYPSLESEHNHRLADFISKKIYSNVMLFQNSLKRKIILIFEKTASSSASNWQSNWICAMFSTTRIGQHRIVLPAINTNYKRYRRSRLSSRFFFFCIRKRQRRRRRRRRKKCIEINKQLATNTKLWAFYWNKNKIRKQNKSKRKDHSMNYFSVNICLLFCASVKINAKESQCVIWCFVCL